MPKKILITGGKGFIGSHLRTRFPRANTFDLQDGQNILNYSQLVRALEGVDVVVHLAALISVSDSLKHAGKYYATNIAGTDNVARAAIEQGCETLIFASSAAVYAPDNPYGLSKQIGEELMEEYKTRMQTISLRFFNIYGAGQNPEYAGVISKFVACAKANTPLQIIGDGTQTRDFISVADICSTIAQILHNRNNIKSGSVFEIGTGKSISINDLAKFFINKYHLSPKYQATGHIGIKHSQANIQSLMSLIGQVRFRSLAEEIPALF